MTLTPPKASPWDCQIPGCTTRLQPLPTSSRWTAMARAELVRLGHPPDNMFLLAHTAHRLIVHDEQP